MQIASYARRKRIGDQDFRTCQPEPFRKKKALNVFWFFKNNINLINAGLILIISLLIMILCELEERSKLLFTIGVITMGIAVALLIITITLSLTNNIFVEQSMGRETAAIVASSVKSLRTYLWFNIFFMHRWFLLNSDQCKGR